MQTRMDQGDINLQSEEARLEEAVRRLVLELDPELVYLFGSRARGDCKPDSDYDFMVIVPDDFPKDPSPTLRGFEAVSGLQLNPDVKTWTHTFFWKQTHLKASMPAAVLRDGRLLYAKPGFEEEPSRSPDKPWLVKEVTEGDYDPVQIDNTRQWLTKARQDLLCAAHEVDGSEEMLGNVLFHCQQAIEKTLKALLTYRDKTFPKAHELKVLGALVNEFEPDLAELVRKSNWISIWSVAGRYPHEGPDPTRQQAEEALAIAKRLFLEALRRLPATASPNPLELS